MGYKKSYDQFITENYLITEEKEKLKVRPAKPSHENGEAAFVVKYVGQQFDEATLKAFLAKSPESAPSFQKVTENPSQYFFIYKTLKNDNARLFSNNHIWVTYLELVNSKDKEGNQIYIGFDKPPYSSFVKWTNVESLINKKDPNVVSVGKQIVNSVNQSGTAQAEAEIQKTEATAQQAATANPTAAPTTEPAKAEPKVLADMATSELLDSFIGLALNSKGQKVSELQSAIEKIATATKNTNAATINAKNKRPDGSFDGIFGPNTAAALKAIIGTDTVDANSVKVLKGKAAEAGLKYADVATAFKKPAAAGTPAPGKDQVAVPNMAAGGGTINVNKSSLPGNATAKASTQKSTPQASRFADTNKGKIYY